MSRKEFTRATKQARYEHAKGCCEECTLPIRGDAEYDHDIEDYIGGYNSFENCRCYCRKCHARKTKENRPAIDKTRRIIAKRMGLKTKRPFPKRSNPWGRHA